MSDKNKIEIIINDEKFEVESDVELSKELDANNSPILYGCRTGICGTCLVLVEEGMENCSELGPDEKDFLEIVSDDSRARLTCQLKCKGPVKLKYIGR